MSRAARLAAEFKAELDPVLGVFLDDQRAGAERAGPPAVALWAAVREFTLRGGKRLRPLLVDLAYGGLGGAERDRTLCAACSIELMQTFLLAHDDVMDRSDHRRGAPTLHRGFEQATGDAHEGEALAILAGDLANAYGAEAIRCAGFDPEVTARALALYHQIVADECYGQALDMASAQSDDDVLRVFHYKTTRYTIEGPLHLGAVLARAPDPTLDALSAFARPLGAAFQLRDDVLDLFGDPASTGKPVGTDVREGKRTLLVLDALRAAPGEVEAALGARDVEAVRRLVREVGALERAQRRMDAWLEQARGALDACGLADPQRATLEAVADHLVGREA